MKRALRKDFFMDIKKSFARFISIFFIVALGVAFFSGIQAASPDMRYSGDAYYDASSLMDLRVMGTYGLTEEDLEAMREVKGVEMVEGGYALDALSGEEGEQRVIHLESLGKNVNQISVIDGRLPEKKGECLVDDQMAVNGILKIGDSIEVYTEESDSILRQKDFIVVGTCSSPMYIAFARGNTTLGSGEVSGFAYVTEENFDPDTYTVAYLLAKGAKSQTSYTEMYDNLVEKVKERVEGIEKERCQARYDSVQEEIKQELEDARQELEDGKAEAQEELAKAKQELEDGKKKLADAKEEYADGRRQLEEGKRDLEEGKKKLADARTQRQDGVNQLAAARRTLDSQQDQLNRSQQQTNQGYADWNASKRELDQKEDEYNNGQAQYADGAAQLSQAKEQLEDARRSYDLFVTSSGVTDPQTEARFDAQAAQIQSQEQALAQSQLQLENARRQLDSGRQELDAAKSQLDAAQAQIDSGTAQMNSGRAQLNERQAQLDTAARTISSNEAQLVQAEKEIKENEQKLDDAAKKIKKNEKKLKKGEKEYADAQKEARETIADGEKKLADAQKDAEGIEMPKWYVDDRDALPEYSGYGDNADRIRNIGRVFPVLFFLVAALISLTTMTRMVEDERTQIGTLKALGYSKGAIASKYLGYALLATLGGSIFGVLIGEKILPYIIITAYGIMYTHMPVVKIPYQMFYALAGSVAAVACTLLATLSACYKELMETPASLMRPASPREGKRVLLEYLPFIWKRLNFTWKSTVRNLFRYKKRFFMTIIGISGCTALMLVGFGLQDSIMDIGSLQYGQLQHFDATVLEDEDATDEEKSQLQDFLETDQRIEKAAQVYFQKMTASGKKKNTDIYLIVPERTDRFSRMVTLRDRIAQEEFSLGEAGVAISEKTAKMLGAKPGDSIDLQMEEGVSGQVKIGKICENYMSHYLYMTPQAYEEAFGEKAVYSDSLVIFQEERRSDPEQIGRDILACPAALSISYTGSIADQLEDMLSSLDSVIVVLIVSAGMLAFVVLYNLNNINITERKRELATLKVLGFYDGEVSAYVFRENVLLTLIGAAAGAGLGILLHRFIIVTVEVDAAMFGRNIYWPSFLYSILFTVGFSAFVNMTMHFKLKKIDMVESLKSVE